MAIEGGDNDRDQPRSGPERLGPLSVQHKLEAAVRLHQIGSLTNAEELYRQVLAVYPRHADALHLLGVIAHQTGQHSRAVDLMREAIAIEPGFAAFHSNLGNVLAELRQFEDAVEAYQAAIGLQPSYAEAHGNLAQALNNLERFDQALAAAETAIQFGGAYPEVLHNKGLALIGLGRPRQAMAALEAALWLRPNYAEARSNLGVALFDLGLIDEAIQAYDAALQLKPDLADAHRNKAYSLLLRGDWAEGWAEYEWRWRAGTAPPRTLPRPQWAGEDIAGQAILLHPEQGMGDTIQFCRYASLVSGRGAKVILEAPRPLARLLSGLRGVDQLVVEGAPLPDFDVHCPLMSLPGVFQTEPETIPAHAAYLAADPAVAAAWSERLGHRSRPRLGLVWSGRAEHRYDRCRSLPLADLLAALPEGFDLISLQQDVRPADQATLAIHAGVRHFGLDLKDFAETAGLVSQMDVVISVDTSVAHLAGALGKDVRLLLPRMGQDWRWLMGRGDTPWYPTMRLYRQSEDDNWTAPLDAVARDLVSRWPPIAGWTTL